MEVVTISFEWVFSIYGSPHDGQGRIEDRNSQGDNRDQQSNSRRGFCAPRNGESCEKETKGKCPAVSEEDCGWVEIEDKKIKNYQCVVPSTWNAGPRDAHGQRGAYEAALLNTPVADPERPVEILRTLHSFDPCLACAVHVVDLQGRIIGKREVA